MSVLVTGGAGFIGSHVVDRLVERGERVVCLDNFDDFYPAAVKRANLQGALASGLVELVEGDIRDAELCRSLLEGGAVGAIIHLAARAGVRPSIEQPALYEDVNCRGTLNLLEAARCCGGVEAFLFGSSSSVYGVSTRMPFREDDPAAAPISPYAATKRSGELLCHVYHHLYGLPVVCLRFFTVYGPRQRPDLAIHKFARLIAEGEPIPLYGDGTSRRDYTHCGDVVAGVLAALELAPKGFEIVNLGSSDPVQLSDLIGLIESNLGKKATIERLPDQPGDVPITCADITKARRLLGYEPRVPIGQGIAEFVEWFDGTQRRGA
jgi:UDP-glucuronate 4-epimerase